MTRHIYHHYPKYERYPTFVASFDEKEAHYQKTVELFNKSALNMSKVNDCFKTLMVSFFGPILASGVLIGVDGALRSRGIDIDVQRIVSEALLPVGLAGTISGLGGALHYMMKDTRINRELSQEINDTFNTNVGGPFLYMTSMPEEHYVVRQEQIF
jgi:hypothetical protein